MLEPMAIAIKAMIIPLGKAFSNIAIAMGGTILFFLMVPQSRVAKAFVIAIIAAICVGFLSYMFGVERQWTTAVAHAISFVGGFFSFTILTVFTRFHALASSDTILIDTIYAKGRGWLLNLLGANDKGEK